MRRVIDVIFGLAGLTLTLPFILIFAFLIKVESAGPVFYKPKMVGWKGKAFSLFRFRTMYTGMNMENRFTPVGSFLRNYSLDHLPQMLNLLKGDLTLVGPRPMEVDIVDLENPTWKQYVRAKPGLFNYAIYRLGKQWTLSRSREPRLNQELELEYMQKRSAKSDLQLFLRSLRMFITSKGNIKERGDTDPDLK